MVVMQLTHGGTNAHVGGLEVSGHTRECVPKVKLIGN